MLLSGEGFVAIRTIVYPLYLLATIVPLYHLSIDDISLRIFFIGFILLDGRWMGEGTEQVRLLKMLLLRLMYTVIMTELSTGKGSIVCRLLRMYLVRRRHGSEMGFGIFHHFWRWIMYIGLIVGRLGIVSLLVLLLLLLLGLDRNHWLDVGVTLKTLYTCNNLAPSI